MPRTPLFSDKLQELKSLAQALGTGLQNQLQEFIHNPQKVADILEEKSPRLSRELLSVASNLTDPFIAGMGLQIEKLEEELVEVTMPQRWKNQADGGEFHTGAVCTLAEFTSKIYWDRHLSATSTRRRVQRLEVQMLNPSRGHLAARYALSSAEREAFLFKLRTEKAPSIDSLVKVYDSQEKLVAEVTIDWQFAAQLALGTGDRNSK